jgi:biopolymer transport protein ExbD
MAGKLPGIGVKRKKGPGPNSEPNVIPFIDIMLVLLIIFMVAAPPPTVDIKVDLPPPNAIAAPPKLDKPTLVVLTEVSPGVQAYSLGNMQGAVPVAGLDELKTKLIEEVRVNSPTMAGDLQKLFSEAKVFVQADQKTAYGNVVGLMAVINEAGFQSVSLVAEEAQTQ